MEKITFCIPSKNNLRYLKWCLPSIRKNAHRKDHDIIVFIDKDTDGTVEWMKENAESLGVKYIVNPDLNNTLYGIGRAYDRCVAEAQTDIVVVFHADMYLCKDADLKMYNKLTENSVVCATRIEPPLHPPGPEKIVMDFGMWPEVDIEDGFKEEELLAFAEKESLEQEGKITHGCFAPWMVHKKKMAEIGGHDPVMKSAREDSDIFNRFILNGMSLIQVRDGLVYHLTCRGGQFEHGVLTKDHSQKSKDWQILMEQSTWDYVRKWGCFVEHDHNLMPIIKPKYDIGFVLTNSEYNAARFLEPWCSTIYLDELADLEFLRAGLQEASSYNPFDRVKSITELGAHDIVVEIDSTKLNNENAKWIGLLNEIITEDQEVGKFELEGLVISINRVLNRNKDLIHVKNEFLN